MTGLGLGLQADNKQPYISLMFPVSRFKDLDFLIQPAQEAINEAVTAAYHEEARVSLGQNDRLRTSQIIALGVNDPAQFRTKINSRACLMSIKKTVVYFDSITTLETAAALLTASLLKMGYLRRHPRMRSKHITLSLQLLIKRVSLRSS